MAVATLVSRQWGERIGGLTSAFPAVVGPALLVSAQLRGAAFAHRAAGGTLLGVVALSGFALAYGSTARGARWPVSLAAGWGTAGLLAAMTVGAGGRQDTATDTLLATLSLLIAHRALPRVDRPARALPPPRRDLGTRMALTAILVLAVTAASAALGPLLGGMLAGLPVLASILAVCTHRQQGAAATIALLRGMLVGMAGFVGFCAILAASIVSIGIAPAFALAILTALGAHALALARVRAATGS